MRLTADDLRRIAAWMRAGGITTLEWTHPNGRLHLVLAPEPPPGRDVTVAAIAAGRFLPAHPARDTAFAPEGTPVRQGDVLGLVQLGPVYSAVTAPGAGIARTLLAVAGARVGYGDPIMVLEEQPA